MLYKKALIIIVLLAISLKGFSQDIPQTTIPPPPPVNHNPLPTAPKDFERFRDRLYFGGNVGAWFGSTTYVNIQPLVGCRITKEFSVGGGFTYNYLSVDYGGQKYSSTIYGPSVFARYLIFENLFAQVGVDHLSVPDYYSILPNDRAWVDNILIGGGYRQPFMDNGSFIAMIFYNVNETPLSPYPNPIIQIGFNIGF